METQQYTQRFLLNKVVTFPYYINYLLGLIIVVPLCFLYGEMGMRYFGVLGLIFTFFISGLIVLSVIKFLSKSVTIYFDKDSLYVLYDDKDPEVYPKKDVAGFYSYNYEQVEKSFISIQILLKNGKKIDFTDINISEKVDKQKAQMLRNFLVVAKRELQFTLIKKNTARSLQKLGAEWYAKAS
ncbi:hypothetical protein [Mucilaginibacter jinjuensis]|uniref:PH domain-containing protein n=1 Tax=Mucilaginibacter jinjuensis TaxID=1176721 RepID=A0ABY7T2I7_9SPHI|nr:hypothetical protein [Mucilaginibacter jinjuensis]WCT10459.1 hypothetical protein PQO05_17115 [Mucilaginibacter jinjuensis]